MKYIAIAILLLTIACTTRGQRAEIFSPNGKAIKGYDPVSFFLEGKALKGTDTLAYTYKDAKWLFSSRQNMEAFKANPDHYVPQYGGYCAFGTADGHKAPTETDTWTIINGKLYFNYNQQVKTLWMEDTSGMIRKADTQWPLIKNKEE
jgi:YHS domain-containing protein